MTTDKQDPSRAALDVAYLIGRLRHPERYFRFPEHVTAALIEDCTKAADMLEADAQEMAALKGDIANYLTTAMAAAVEIQEHWAAHCDDEGYGPINLVRRLENGFPAQYGYTAQSFVEMERQRDEAIKERDALRAQQVEVPQGVILLDAEQMHEVIRDVFQHIQQGYLHEGAMAKQNSSYGTGMCTHIWHQMRKLSAMLKEATHPAYVPLTDGEIMSLYDGQPQCDADMCEFARAIEQAVRGKT